MSHEKCKANEKNVNSMQFHVDHYYPPYTRNGNFVGLLIINRSLCIKHIRDWLGERKL